LMIVQIIVLMLIAATLFGFALGVGSGRDEKERKNFRTAALGWMVVCLLIAALDWLLRTTHITG
jgi:hypothetical protein